KEKFRHLIIPGSVDEFRYDPEEEEEEEEVTKRMAGDAKPAKEDTVLARRVARQAAAYITTNKPALCFIHLTDPDNTGHKFGWGSPQQIKSFANVDAAIGRIMQSIETAGILQQSVVIITADHGGHAKTHGLNTPEDMMIPWIAWGSGVRKGF